jgi:hypothetical protein
MISTLRSTLKPGTVVWSYWPEIQDVGNFQWPEGWYKGKIMNFLPDSDKTVVVRWGM